MIDNGTPSENRGNDVRPFKAIYYNPDKVKEIGQCLSQPYDVIALDSNQPITSNMSSTLCDSYSIGKGLKTTRRATATLELTTIYRIG